MSRDVVVVNKKITTYWKKPPNSFGYAFLDAYPSAYHPPPLRLKVHGEMIFLAFLRHLGHWISLVPIFTNFSVTVPSEHLNSYTGMIETSPLEIWYTLVTQINIVKAIFPMDLCFQVVRVLYSEKTRTAEFAKIIYFLLS